MTRITHLPQGRGSTDIQWLTGQGSDLATDHNIQSPFGSLFFKGSASLLALFCCYHEEHEGQLRNRRVRLVRGRRHSTLSRAPPRGRSSCGVFRSKSELLSRNSPWTWMTAWICALATLFNLDINRMEFIVPIVLTHCPMALELYNQAVHRSGRRKELRPSLLDEQVLT